MFGSKKRKNKNKTLVTDSYGAYRYEKNDRNMSMKKDNLEGMRTKTQSKATLHNATNYKRTGENEKNSQNHQKFYKARGRKTQTKKRKQTFFQAIKSFFSKVYYTMVFAIFIVMLLMTINRYSTISNIKYQINEKNIQIKSIENDIKVETVKLYDLTTTEIIEDKAKNELGMQQRTPEQIVYIDVE